MRVAARPKPIFRVNSPDRFPISKGLSYGMLREGKSENQATIPLPVFSSLFQRILIHRWQVSSYISSLRNYGMRPDYPAAKVMTMIPSGPSNKSGNVVTVSRFGRPSTSGTMKAPKRFRKALSVTSIPYTPPEY